MVVVVVEEDMWPGGKVCLKPTCVFLDEVVCCRKGWWWWGVRGVGGGVWGKRLPPNVGLADSIKKISKGPFMRCCKEERVF